MATKKRWSITTEQACQDALKCTTRTEFSVKFSGSLRHLRDKGFEVLDDACSHMTGYTQWTTEKCVDVARTYKTRSEFRKGNLGAYSHMTVNKLHDLCYSHMGPPEKLGVKLGSKNKKRRKPVDTDVDKLFDMIMARINE